MQKNEAYYQSLLLGFIDNTLSLHEVNELLEFIQSQPSLYNSLLNSKEIRQKLSEQAYNSNIHISEAVSARMKERLLAAVQEDDHEAKPVVRFLAGNWRWMAAAVVVIVVATVIVMPSGRKSKSTEPVVVKPAVNDVLPGGNKATLRLGNGQLIMLDSAGNGSLAIQGSTKVVKLANGEIAYNVDGNVPTEVMYNTMSTPAGGQFKLKLPDGTNVWLNAASSITYPTAFVGKHRTVTITGEVYFEVSPLLTSPPVGGGGKRKKIPFIVKFISSSRGGREGDVEVLGTHFNVNTYVDEPDMKVTLLEGSVKVKSGNSVVLKPGEQAAIVAAHSPLTTPHSPIIIDHSPDLDQVMAWKNGLFNFNKVSLQDVMKQIARWYDVEVVYQGEIRPKKFGGEIQRDLNLSEVLDGLKKTGIHFRIEGKKLIVFP